MGAQPSISTIEWYMLVQGIYLILLYVHYYYFAHSRLQKTIVQSDDWITKHAYLLDVYISSQTRGLGQFTNYFYYISNFKWSIKALYKWQYKWNLDQRNGNLYKHLILLKVLIALHNNISQISEISSYLSTVKMSDLWILCKNYTKPEKNMKKVRLIDRKHKKYCRILT